MHSGIDSSFSTSALDKIKVMGVAVSGRIPRADGADRKLQIKSCKPRRVARFGRRDGRKQATMSVQQMTRLRVALGDYALTVALKQKEIASQSVAFNFADVKPVYKVFGTMVRERAFDVSEMAIVTYLQAK